MPPASERNQGHAALFSGQRKPACGRQIELFRIAPRLQQNDAKGLATQGFFRCSEGLVGVGDLDQQEFGGVKPVARQPRTIGFAQFPARRILPDPDPRRIVRA